MDPRGDVQKIIGSFPGPCPPEDPSDLPDLGRTEESSGRSPTLAGEDLEKSLESVVGDKTLGAKPESGADLQREYRLELRIPGEVLGPSLRLLDHLFQIW